MSTSNADKDGARSRSAGGGVTQVVDARIAAWSGVPLPAVAESGVSRQRLESFAWRRVAAWTAYSHPGGGGVGLLVLAVGQGVVYCCIEMMYLTASPTVTICRKSDIGTQKCCSISMRISAISSESGFGSFTNEDSGVTESWSTPSWSKRITPVGHGGWPAAERAAPAG